LTTTESNSTHATFAARHMGPGGGLLVRTRSWTEAVTLA